MLHVLEVFILITRADLNNGIHSTDKEYLDTKDAWFTGINRARGKKWIGDPVGMISSAKTEELERWR